MNRKQRRAGLKIHRTEVKKSLKDGKWTEWEDITIEARAKIADAPESHRLLRFYKNNLYTVQIIKVKEGELVGIRRLET